jgi:hypothetical protein
MHDKRHERTEVLQASSQIELPSSELGAVNIIVVCSCWKSNHLAELADGVAVGCRHESQMEVVFLSFARYSASIVTIMLLLLKERLKLSMEGLFPLGYQ